MLACRVCLAVGIDDPEAWLDQASDRQLALWAAFYRMEPWGAEFHRSATLATMQSGLMAMQAASHGQEMEVQSFETFMPSDWAEQPKKKKRRKKGFDAKATEAMFAEIFPTAEQRIKR